MRKANREPNRPEEERLIKEKQQMVVRGEAVGNTSLWERG